MARITSGALKFIPRILGITGLESQTTDLEDGVVQPVLDISRIVSLEGDAGGQSGFWVASAFQTHAGAGFLSDTLDLVAPAVASEAYSLDVRTQWAWVMRAWAVMNNATDFANCTISLQPTTGDRFIGPSDASPASALALLFRGDSASGIATPGPVLDNRSEHLQLPMLVLSPEDGILFTSTSQAAGTVEVTHNLLLWIGTRGVMPPGMM